MFRSGFIMKPVFAQAKTAPMRVVYAEGEDERILRAAQVVVEEGLARPILVGRPAVVEARLERFGLSIRPGRDFELINPEDDPRYRDFVGDLYRGRRPARRDAGCGAHHRAHQRYRDRRARGAPRRGRRHDLRRRRALHGHLKNIRDVIGLAPGIGDFSALSLVITARGIYFLADTQVRPDPTAVEIAEMAVLAAAHVRRFGIEPKIALLSHSDFGSYETPSAHEDAARRRAPRRAPSGARGRRRDAAAIRRCCRANRERVFPHSRLKGEANVLIMPNLDAANIAYQLIKVLADALPVGPILIGAARPAHILTPSVTARGVVNMTAVAVVEAQAAAQRSLTSPTFRKS